MNLSEPKLTMQNHHIHLEEQGLRDGLQTLPKVVPTEQKLDYINRLIAAGLRRIQVVSFVHPRLVPQMADAEAVCAGLPDNDDVLFSGLALNSRGVERGIKAGLLHLSCSISASDTHSQRNARKTLTEAKADFKKMIAICRPTGGLKVRGGIQCAFGCRFEGYISPQHVMDMVKHHLDQGIDELALADSTGMGNPLRLGELMARVLEEARDIPVILHLHNTESKGYANIFAAVQAGVRYFDTAFGGLGGCPFIKNATGNVATEDTIHLLHQMGFTTGIDVHQVAAISKDMENFLGHQLPGQLYTLVGRDDIKMNYDS